MTTQATELHKRIRQWAFADGYSALARLLGAYCRAAAVPKPANGCEALRLVGELRTTYTK